MGEAAIHTKYTSWKEILDSFVTNGTIPKIFVTCETLFNEETGEYDKTMYHFKTNYAGRSCGGGGFTPDECGYKESFSDWKTLFKSFKDSKMMYRVPFRGDEKWSKLKTRKSGVGFYDCLHSL